MKLIKEAIFELFAQRAVMRQTFYAYKFNLEDNGKRIAASVRLLENNINKKDQLFCSTDLPTLLNTLNNQTDFSQSELLFILQCLNKQKFTPESILFALYKSEQLALKTLAPLFALQLANGIVLPLPDNACEALFNLHLLYKFYNQEQLTLAEMYQQSSSSLSPLTRLYLQVLSRHTENAIIELESFMELDYLESHLFQLFIISLDEIALTQVVNRLSANSQHISIMIEVMALSGFSKFIPFILECLQDVKLSLKAFHALRLMMGEKLDEFIPNHIQFNVDESKKVHDLGFYGAQILASWDASLLTGLGPCILDGLALTKKNIAYILDEGSQIHRQVAALQQTKLASEKMRYFAYSGVKL